MSALVWCFKQNFNPAIYNGLLIFVGAERVHQLVIFRVFSLANRGAVSGQ